MLSPAPASGQECGTLFWRIEDPPAFQATEEEKLAKYCEIRDVIRARLQEWAAGMGY